MIPELEKAFSETTGVLLGKPLSGLVSYEKWLSAHVQLPFLAKSSKSGKEVWMQPALYFMNRKFSTKNALLMEEVDLNAPSPLPKEKLEGANLSKIATELIKPIAFVCGNFRWKSTLNIEKTSGAGDCANVYKGEDVYHATKNVAYALTAMYSQNIFGGYAVWRSKYCMKCYDCINVTRAFECDACFNCSDIYFCHNVENCTDCMFCFNAKNKKHAIGNIEFSREEYLKVKSKILSQIADELEKTKSLKYDIYNIGCAKQ